MQYEATFELDIPPSVNAMYRNVRGIGRVKSAEYLRWERGQLKFVMAQRVKPVTPPVAIKVALPETMRGDLSNRFKAIEDLIVKAGIIPDDSKRFVRSISMDFHDKNTVRVRVISLAEAA